LDFAQALNQVAQEYIDPISKSANNIVDENQVELKQDTLYVLSGAGSMDCSPNEVNLLGTNNYFTKRK